MSIHRWERMRKGYHVPQLISFFTLLFLLSFFSCGDLERLGPEPEEAFVKYHGSAYNQLAADMIKTDKGYLLVGTTDLDSPDNLSKMYLVQTDEGGNHFQTNTISASDEGIGIAHSILPVGDGFLICGTVTQQGQEDVWLVKVDSNLQEEWQQVYGETETNESALAMTQTGSGMIVLVGTTDNIASKANGAPTNAIDSSDVFVLKIDIGNRDRPIWQKTYGYAGVDQGTDIISLGGEDLIVLGTTDYPDNGTLDKDVFLISLNREGNPKDTQTFGDPDMDEIATQMILTENELAITGSRDDQLLFLRVNPISLKSLIGPLSLAVSGTGSSGHAIASHEKTNYLIVGRGGNTGNQEALLIETADGLVIHERIFGGQGKDCGAAVLAVPNGIALLGTFQFGTNDMMGLVKVRPDGSL